MATSHSDSLILLLLQMNTHLCVEMNIHRLETNIHLLETNTDMCVESNTKVTYRLDLTSCSFIYIDMLTAP